MNERQQDIGDLFYDAVEGQGSHPPATLWEGIEAQLDKTPIPANKVSSRPQYRYFPFFLMMTLFTLLLALPSDNRLVHQKHTLGNPQIIEPVRATEGQLAPLNHLLIIPAKPLPGRLPEELFGRTTFSLQEVIHRTTTSATSLYFQEQLLPGQELFAPHKLRRQTLKNQQTAKQPIYNNAENSWTNPSFLSLAGNDQVAFSFHQPRALKSISVSGVDNLPLPINILAPAIAKQTSQRLVNSTRKHPVGFSIAPYLGIGTGINEASKSHDHQLGHDSKDYHDLHVYTAGIQVMMPLYKRWFATAGIAYRYQAEKIASTRLIANRTNNGSGQYILHLNDGYVNLTASNGNNTSPGDSLSVKDANAVLHYLTVPLALNYTMLKGRFQIIPGIGVQFNLLVANHFEAAAGTGNQPATRRVYDLQGVKSFVVEPFTSLGLQFNAGKRLSLIATPSISIHFIAVTAGARYFIR